MMRKTLTIHQREENDFEGSGSCVLFRVCCFLVLLITFLEKLILR